MYTNHLRPRGLQPRQGLLNCQPKICVTEIFRITPSSANEIRQKALQAGLDPVLLGAGQGLAAKGFALSRMGPVDASRDILGENIHDLAIGITEPPAEEKQVSTESLERLRKGVLCVRHPTNGSNDRHGDGDSNARQQAW